MTADQATGAGAAGRVSYLPGAESIDVIDSDGQLVAVVFVREHELETSLRIAHEMAASPMLLAALEKIVHGPCEPDCDSKWGAPCSCWLDVARAAITAARPAAAAPTTDDGAEGGGGAS